MGPSKIIAATWLPKYFFALNKFKLTIVRMRKKNSTFAKSIRNLTKVLFVLKSIQNLTEVKETEKFADKRNFGKPSF